MANAGVAVTPSWKNFVASDRGCPRARFLDTIPPCVCDLPAEDHGQNKKTSQRVGEEKHFIHIKVFGI
jgi:hypothetical protein